jgi:diaminopimelate decarboxylase
MTTDFATELANRYFTTTAGELHIGGLPIGGIVEEFGTPLYVYDRAILDEKWRLLRLALPPDFGVSYSIKANPNRTILQFFLGKGCGLEVASGGELHRALSAGCAPQQIIYAGPGKTEAELEQAIAANIGEIHAESMLELERIAAICGAKGTTARVALRINPTETAAQGGAMRMAGKPAPFGLDEVYLPAALAMIGRCSALEFCGIHLFMGTQILDHETLLTQYRHGLEIGRRAAQLVNQPLQTLDFGGGLGIRYFAHERALDMAALKNGLAELFAEYGEDEAFSGTKFMVEPGRYLVGEAGLYVVRVNDIKISQGKKFVILDGGMHHHLAASGNLGQTIKRNFPLALLNKLNAPCADLVEVVGPLCTPLDTLGRSVMLPAVEVGDLVGVFQSGAYARTASPLGFLSHPSPPEVWVEEGQTRLIRRRGRYDDDECEIV